MFDAAAEKLAAAFWPGPLTLVLKKRAGCPVAELATAGLDSIAVRVPEHPVALAHPRRLGRPVVAPSANRSGHVSPTTAQHVMADLGGRIDFIVDGGPAPVGVESTIVGCLDRPMLLRPGGLPRAADRGGAGRALADVADAAFDRTRRSRRACSRRTTRRARGCGSTSTASSPARRCWRSAPDCRPGRRMPRSCSTCRRAAIWSRPRPTCSPICARSTGGVATIAVMPIPHEGLGEAINDRLARAAAPREVETGVTP